MINALDPFAKREEFLRHGDISAVGNSKAVKKVKQYFSWTSLGCGSYCYHTILCEDCRTPAIVEEHGWDEYSPGAFDSTIADE